MSQQDTSQVLTKAAEKSCPIINKKTIFGALAVLVAGYAVYRLNKHAAEKRYGMFNKTSIFNEKVLI